MKRVMITAWDEGALSELLARVRFDQGLLLGGMAALGFELQLHAWLTWFLECLHGAIDGARHSTEDVRHKARLWERINEGPVNERQRLVIDRMLDGFRGHMTTSKYARLTRCSTDTALRDVRELLARGILVRNPGAGRSASYRLAPPDRA